MKRRDILLGGVIVAASGIAAVPQRASAAPGRRPSLPINNRGTHLIKYRFKPGGRDIWEAYCVELEQRRAEVKAGMESEGSRTESCFLSEDGDGIYYFEDIQDYDKAYAAYTHSDKPLDAEHKVKKEQCLEKVGELKVLFEFHNPLMS